MKSVTGTNQSDIIEIMKENKKNIRKLVMDSYQDIQKGKGKDYKEFFTELERRYQKIEI